MQANSMVRVLGGLGISLGILAGCGGSQPAAEPPPETSPEPAPSAQEEAPPPKKEEEPAPPPKASAPDPEFKAGGSVDEAIAAVPKDASRIDVDPDVLSEPLLKPALYETCKAKSHEHFTLRVAVWDGRVVGVDVTTKPKNDKLASCVREQVEGVTYKDKAKSLGIVSINL